MINRSELEGINAEECYFISRSVEHHASYNHVVATISAKIIKESMEGKRVASLLFHKSSYETYEKDVKNNLKQRGFKYETQYPKDDTVDVLVRW